MLQIVRLRESVQVASSRRRERAAEAPSLSEEPIETSATSAVAMKPKVMIVANIVSNPCLCHTPWKGCGKRLENYLTR